MILVTDATSRVGATVARQLAQDGHDVRALVPGRARAARLESYAVQLEIGSIGDQRATSRALDGVQTVVLVSGAAPELVSAQEQFIQVARGSSVSRIVKLSVAGASPESRSELARLHARIEQQLQYSGIPSCSVRATRFMQAVELQVSLILSASILTGCQGSGRVADVDVRDVASVLATLATGSGDRIVPRSVAGVHREPAAGDGVFEWFDLTGPAALTRGEMASILSHELGRHITYVDVTPASLLQCAEAAGFPQWQATDGVDFEAAARAGQFADVSPAGAQILGRPLREFAAFAHELAVSVRYSQAPGTLETASPIA